MRSFWTAPSVLLVVILFCGCGSGKPPAPPKISEDAAAIRTFLSDAGLQKSPLSAYIRGKMLVLNRTAKGIQADLHELLPPDRVAGNRDEVETVVWIDWSTSRLSDIYYRIKGKNYYAVVWNADLTVIDWSRKLILGGPRVTGSPPTKEIGLERVSRINEADGVPGERPMQQIADALVDLARSIGVPK